MSTLTLKPTFPMHSASGSSSRSVRAQEVREAMQPRRERTLALTAGVIAIALFSIFAPSAGDPTERLFALDAMPTIATDEVPWERPFALPPTAMGPAITSEALMRVEDGALHMPPLEVTITLEGEEVIVVHASEG